MAYVIVTKLAVAKPQRNKQRKAAELRCCTGIWPLAFFLVSPPQTLVADVGRYPLRTWAPAILSECPLGSPHVRPTVAQANGNWPGSYQGEVSYLGWGYRLSYAMS